MASEALVTTGLKRLGLPRKQSSCGDTLFEAVSVALVFVRDIGRDYDSWAIPLAFIIVVFDRFNGIWCVSPIVNGCSIFLGT